ncbi:FAD-binding domain-containing protein [Stemphylium lycopersici]|nr:FAD-binding domain-containing protein [Stemphylium lycopersici]
MPRFFKRIFTEHLFRREADVSDVQRSRRVLVRPSTNGLYEHASHWRSGFFDAQVNAEEHRALRDGASVVGSDAHAAEQPILVPNDEQIPARKPSRTSNDACWPSLTEWQQLNATLNGSLIQSIPPGSVCYTSQPNYNPEACALVMSRWLDSTFHASNPVSVDYPIWANNSCNPIYANGTSVTRDPGAGTKGCNIGSYPAYVVNATSDTKVSTALKWASERDIRLVIKATGHSYQGRSTGYGSLSIWTHHMRGIDYLPTFKPTSCDYEGSLTAVRVSAGHTNIQVQEEVARYGRAIVTGSNPSVGLVGWLTGGGHGPLSTSYGMGADNLLEATIVTPDGEVRLANPCKNQRLFAAIRGGGGGTFGVITNVVVRAFPTPRTSAHTFQVRSTDTNTSDAFYEFLGFLHSEMQRLKEGGMQGYYLIVGPPIVPTLSFSWTFALYDAPNGTVERLMEPIKHYMEDRKDIFAWQSRISHYETYLEMHKANFPNEKVADGGSAYGSRLLSPRSLDEPDITAKVFAQIGPSNDALKPNAPVSNPILIGHMIASPSLPSYFPTRMYLNPAWRHTLTHLIVVSPFSDDTPQQLIDAVYTDITHSKTQALRRLDPETGAYFSEADSYEPEWQQAFWGESYEDLRLLKRGIDPQSLLWCRRCVGSEELVEMADGRLCRTWMRREHDEL